MEKTTELQNIYNKIQKTYSNPWGTDEVRETSINLNIFIKKSRINKLAYRLSYYKNEKLNNLKESRKQKLIKLNTNNNKLENNHIPRIHMNTQENSQESLAKGKTGKEEKTKREI